MDRHVVVHIGDVHLQHGHPRNADRLQALDQIVNETIAREDLALVLIPGDLFHQKSTPDDRNALAARLLRLANVAPVLMVRGNHDAVGDLEIFARLQARWPIMVVTHPTVMWVTLPTGAAAAVACLPYPDKYGLVAAGVPHADLSGTALQLLDSIFLNFAYTLTEAAKKGAIPLFMAHANIRGAISSTGQPQIGQELELDVALLGRLPVLYWAMNHIHRAQVVGQGNFAGSVAAMDHGETEAKSYNVIEVLPFAEGAWSAVWTREPIHTPPLFHVDGVVTRDGFRLAEGSGQELERRWHAGDWTDADVRVRFTYQQSERALVNRAAIEAKFPGALRLKVEGVAVPDRELRAPEVAAATTLAAKLAAFSKVDTLPTSRADKLALLEIVTDWPDSSVTSQVALALKAIENHATRESASVAA